MLTKKLLSELEYKVIGACIEVQKHIGCGLLENIYQKCLIREFQLRDIQFLSQQSVLLHYKGVDLDTEIRTDFFIENSIVLELKSVKEILPIHEAQLITYMNLLHAPKGILVNFYSTNIVHDGSRSFVSDYYRDLPA